MPNRVTWIEAIDDPRIERDHVLVSAKSGGQDLHFRMRLDEWTDFIERAFMRIEEHESRQCEVISIRA